MGWRDFYRKETKGTEKEIAIGIKDWEQRSKILLDWLMREGVGKDSRILDCGCGIGIAGLILKENGYDNIVGLDIDKENVKSASRFFKAYEMDCNKMNLKDNFNVVIALNIIEHLENPETFLKKINKITKPSGIMILSLPNEIWFRKLLNRVPENSEHKQHWSCLQFRKFIGENGLRIESIKPVGRIPFLLGCQTFMVKAKFVK